MLDVSKSEVNDVYRVRSRAISRTIAEDGAFVYDSLQAVVGRMQRGRFRASTSLRGSPPA